MLMEIQDLIKFGMTKTEAKIYLELSKLGETKIGDIIKITGLHRGTVYNALNDLIEKGFVGFVDVQEGRMYKVSGKSIFLNVVDEKHKEIEAGKKHIDEFFRQLSRLKQEVTEQKVKVLYGLDAFKMLFLDMYKECRAKKTEYLFMGEGGKMSDAVGLGYYKHTQKLKKDLKIKCRIILSRESRSLPYHQYCQGNKRYMPTKVPSPVNFWIYGSKVLFVIWDSKPLVSIVVQSNQLANGFRNHFEGLWNALESEQRHITSRQLINFYEFLQNSNESIDIMGINCLILLHEGRDIMVRLLKKGKTIRVLLMNPDSEVFRKRVELEEQFAKNAKQGRMFYEYMSVLENLKDIKSRTKGKGRIEAKLYSRVPSHFVLILDNKRALLNAYKWKKGKYGHSEATLQIYKEDKEFKIARQVFDEYWRSAKAVKLR
jgi:DNA-binding MarR family transcriptional regulator